MFKLTEKLTPEAGYPLLFQTIECLSQSVQTIECLSQSMQTMEYLSHSVLQGLFSRDKVTLWPYDNKKR